MTKPLRNDVEFFQATLTQTPPETPPQIDPRTERPLDLGHLIALHRKAAIEFMQERDRLHALLTQVVEGKYISPEDTFRWEIQEALDSMPGAKQEKL